jgi:hypothetical protein
MCCGACCIIVVRGFHSGDCKAVGTYWVVSVPSKHKPCPRPGGDVETPPIQDQAKASNGCRSHRRHGCRVTTESRAGVPDFAMIA